jgi:hypothetical protein
MGIAQCIQLPLESGRWRESLAQYFEEIVMRTLLGISIFLLTAVPAFAQVADDTVSIPEPGVLGLIGIGALAILIGRRGKK